MKCADACHLLEQGVAPGTADIIRTTLGFHLAACQPCREYRAQRDAKMLLQGLLAQPLRAELLAARPVRQPARRMPYLRATSAALLVAGTLAALPLSQSMPLRAATFEPVAARPITSARSVKAGPKHAVVPRRDDDAHRLLSAMLSAPVHTATKRSPEQVAVEPRGARVGIHADRAEVSSLRDLVLSAAAAAASENQAMNWASFAPRGSVDVARSQIAAFEKAGPQQLPPQVFNEAALDTTLAQIPLQVGQTLILPEDPQVPEPPPQVIAVPAENLPPLPRTPSTPAKPTVKPAVKPRPTTKPAKTAIKPPAKPVPARTYVVQAGDTLTSIALRYYDNEARWQDIYRANRTLIGSNPNLIYPKQQLVIPTLGAPNPQPQGQPKPPTSYTVQSGDTLTAIALRYYGNANLWPLLYEVNQKTIGGNPDLIFPRQLLNVPQRGTTTPSPITRPTLGQRTYTVKAGDTLTAIALRFYDNDARWQEIYRANRQLIADPGHLQIGATLVIP